MTPSRDPATLVCASIYMTLTLYAVGLWVFALFRTRMVFCYFYIVAALVSLFYLRGQRWYVSRPLHMGSAARQKRLDSFILLHHRGTACRTADRRYRFYDTCEVAHEEA